MKLLVQVQRFVIAKFITRHDFIVSEEGIEAGDLLCKRKTCYAIDA